MRIAPLFAAIFLCAQFLAAAHSAAYADADHLHDGTPCIIAAANKQGDSLDVAHDIPTLERQPVRALISDQSLSPLVGTTIAASSIRGPPTSN